MQIYYPTAWYNTVLMCVYHGIGCVYATRRTPSSDDERPRFVITLDPTVVHDVQIACIANPGLRAASAKRHRSSALPFGADTMDVSAASVGVRTSGMEWRNCRRACIIATLDHVRLSPAELHQVRTQALLFPIISLIKLGLCKQ